MTARRPADEPLVGRFIRLSPFTEADIPGLYRALGHPEVFAGGFGGGPAGLPADAEAFEAFAGAYYAGGSSAMPWTVRLVGGPDDSTVVGATKLGDLDLPDESAHIGWTAYDPRVWGTAVNPEIPIAATPNGVTSTNTIVSAVSVIEPNINATNGVLLSPMPKKIELTILYRKVGISPANML